MIKKLIPLFASLLALPALAHEGHGLEGPHIHSWDALGWSVIAVAAVAGAWWYFKGRK